MDWDKDLFQEINEQEKVLPPEAGIPDELVKFLSSENILNHPIIRRKNYITDDWCHINVVRAERPYAKVKPLEEKPGEVCLFCPGKEDHTPRDILTKADTIRLGSNPWALRVFPNLYPWLLNHLNIVETNIHKIYLKDLDIAEELNAIKVICSLTKQLEEKDLYPVVFRNQGQGAGASLPHYHWQVGALSYIPARIREEVKTAEWFYKKYGKNIFDAIILSEREQKKRFICDTEFFSCIAPFAPRTNFEIWIIANKELTSFSQLTEEQIKQFTKLLCDILLRLNENAGIDSLFIICHQLVKNPFYRLHVELFPIKNWSGAERGFGEFVVEVAPEKTKQMFETVSL